MDWQKLSASLAEASQQILSYSLDFTPSPQDIVESIDILTNHLSTTMGNASHQVNEEDFFHRIRLSPEPRNLLKVRNASIGAYDRHPTESNRIRMYRLQWDVKSRVDEARNTR